MFLNGRAAPVRDASQILPKVPYYTPDNPLTCRLEPHTPLTEHFIQVAVSNGSLSLRDTPLTEHFIQVAVSNGSISLRDECEIQVASKHGLVYKISV